jgi:hypothetical protein
MRGVSRWVFTVVVVALGCRHDPPLAYKEPAAGSYTTRAYQMKIGEAVTSVQGATLTMEFFGAAGIQPLVGRFFVGDDYLSSTRRVVVLSHDLWAERFASSPSIVGREIELDGHPATVVGVAPRGFRFPDGALLWMPKDTSAP